MTNFTSNPIYQNVALTPAISSNITVIRGFFDEFSNQTDFSDQTQAVHIQSNNTGSFNQDFTSFYNNLEEGDLLVLYAPSPFLDNNAPTILKITSLGNFGVLNDIFLTNGFSYDVLQGSNNIANFSFRNIVVERHLNNGGVFSNNNNSERVAYAPVIGSLFSQTQLNIFSNNNGNIYLKSRFNLNRYYTSTFPPSSNYNNNTYLDTPNRLISNTLPRLEAFHFNLFETYLNAYNVSGSSADDFQSLNGTGPWSSGDNIFTEEEEFAYERHIKLGASTYNLQYGYQNYLTYQDSLTSSPEINGFAGVNFVDGTNYNMDFTNDTDNKKFTLGNISTGYIENAGEYRWIGGVLTGTFELR